MASKNKKPGKTAENLNQKGIIRIDGYLSGILLAAIAFIPLVVRIKTTYFVSPSLTAGVFTGLRGETFNNYKFALLVLVAIALVTLLLAKIVLYRYQIRPSFINPVLLVLTAVLLLALFLAEYKSIALYGNFERREGTLTFLCYLAIFFVAANTRFSQKFFTWLPWALGLVVGVNLILGLAAYTGHDLFNSPTVQALITPSGMEEHTVAGSLATTLANPNYVSGLFAALFAFFVILGLKAETTTRKIAYSLLGIASFVNLVLSQSSSGFAALAAALPLLVVLLLAGYRPRFTIKTAGIAVAALILFLVVLIAFKPLVTQVAISDSLTILQEMKQHYTQKSPADNTITHPLELPPPGMAPGSGRLYIWSKTIALIIERPLLGYGMDTLAYHFPQNDPQKQAGLSTYSILIDKPHNYYLEVAFGAGLTALLSLLVLWGYVLRQTGRAAFQSPDHSRLAAALLAFLAVFLLQWLANDSALGSSLIFWSLLGVAVSASLKDPIT